MKHYAPNRCEPSFEVIMKMGSNGGGGQGGCEREQRIKVIVKIQGGCKRRRKVKSCKNAKKLIWGWGQGRYERKIED